MNIAFIPVRGGSKSIPLKNIKKICGKPLVYWTIKAACECNNIDKVYVATDSSEIKKCISEFSNCEEAIFSKLVVVGRTAESASDTASTEFAMIEFAEKYQFDNIVLIQATSPLITVKDLNKGFEEFNKDSVDSVLSGVRQKRFNWDYNEKGFVYPLNYDVYNRPRRQDFAGYLTENGAFYITSRDRLLNTKSRISGNIAMVEMDEDSFYEIDELSDWKIIELLMKRRGISGSNFISNVKLFLTDCDGCLTDAGMYYSESGDELKKFNTRDGMGFKLLRDKGIITGIITGENVELVKRRAKKLGIDELIVGCIDKATAIKELCAKYEIDMENVVYIGDDINDIEAIKSVGVGCCPSDAMPQVKDISTIITRAKGGEGVIREVVETIFSSINEI